MTNPVGSFIWYELITPDPDAAAVFYKAVVGWTFEAEPEPQPGVDYRMIRRTDGGFNGGVLTLTEEMRAGGAAPGWLPYLYVAEIDAAIAAVEADGGRSLMPKMTIAEGTFAPMLDPQGVPIYLMTPTPPPERAGMASDVFDPMAPQRVNWNELGSPDQDGSIAFYAKHFGFAFDEAMSMGDMGDYSFIDHHGQRLGAIMRKGMPGPARWLQYFGVPSIAAAKTDVEGAGGTVLMGPHEVPGPVWILVCTDPQGATFGLVGPKGD